MTKSTWQPDLSDFSGPRYLALASALERDIASGRLGAGERLPTHRDLAWQLGVTVGTVSRGYAEALRRGLLTGEVGRGTFVSGDVVSAFNPAPIHPMPMRGGNAAGLINMSANLPPISIQKDMFADMMRELADDPALAQHLVYPPYVGTEPVRQAAARWLSETALPVTADRVFVTAGCQQALMVAFHLAARPGDTVLVERLTYPGVKALAHMMQVRLVGVDMDEDGITPDSLDTVCRSHAPKLLCMVPTLQNPMNSIMSDERRRAVAEVADRHELPILEDGIYNFLDEHRATPVTAYTKTPGYYVTSMSKSVSSALRTGLLIAAPDMRDAITRLMGASCLHAPNLMAEALRRWIDNGTVAHSEQAVRQDIARRQALAREKLQGLKFDTHEFGFHMWVHLPEPWRPLEFSLAAEERGIAVAPAEAFAIGREQAPFAVRISLTGPRDLAELAKGLDILAALLDTAPAPTPAFV
jgi:DNA-binding transcriptional MocR family regulator